MTNPSDTRKRILFVLPSLVAGGAERVMSYIAQNLDSKKFEAILLLTGFESDTVYDVKGIRVIYLNKKRVLHAIPDLFKSIRKIKPNIVLGSIGHINIVLSFLSVFFKKVKFIGREANVISVLNEVNSGKKNKDNYKVMTKVCYGLLDKIICQSNDMADDLKSNYKIDPKKISIINNPITASFENIALEKINTTKNKEKIQFITVGSLEKRKGHSRILKILNALEIPFHYTIVGNGSLKEDIFNEIEELNLSDKITHIPYTANVNEFLMDSDVFLLGSYVEGFPNAVIESCAIGVPVIAFNIKGGINEIIAPGINGFIAKDDSEYLGFLEKEHHWNSTEISNHVKNKFGSAIILKKYEQLFDTLINQN